MDNQTIDLRKQPATSNTGNKCDTITVDRNKYKMLLSSYNGFNLLNDAAKDPMTFEDAVRLRTAELGQKAYGSHNYRIRDIALLNEWIKFMTLE